MPNHWLAATRDPIQCHPNCTHRQTAFDTEHQAQTWANTRPGAVHYQITTEPEPRDDTYWNRSRGNAA